VVFGQYDARGRACSRQYPQRTRGLVLVNTTASFLPSECTPSLNLAARPNGGPGVRPRKLGHSAMAKIRGADALVTRDT